MILAELFIPHGHCYLWKPGLVGLHIISDALIALAYYSIPLTLTYFVVKRRDVPFNWIFLLFGAFIISCGTGHVMDIWTLWYPNYWLSGFVKAFTAIVSLYTAGELSGLLPQALAIPSAAQFEAVKNEIQERQRAEVALLREKTHLALAQKVAHVGSWEFDLVTRAITWSDETFRIYGLHPEQLTPTLTEHRQKIHSDDRTIWDTTINQLLEGKSGELEHRIVRPDGSIRHLLSQGQPIFGSDGQVEKLFGTVLDITERKLAEQAQARLTAILEATPDIVGICDATGHKIYVNPAGRRFHGIEPDGNIANHQLSECHPPEVADFILTQAIPAAIANGVWRGEILWRRWDGAVFPTSHVIIAHKSERGKVEYISTIARDISDRKRVEAELRSTQQFLNSLLENLPLSVFAKDARELRCVFWNKAIAELMGYSASEVLGKSDYDLFPVEQANFFTVQDREALSSGKLVENPAEPIHTHRGQRIFHVKKIPIFDEVGNPQYLLGIAEDITERLQAEAALRDSEERFRQLTENIHQVFWMVSIEPHQMLYVSPAYEKIWQRSSLKLYEQPNSWFDTIHPEDKQRVLAAHQHIQSGDYNEEYRIVRPNGSIRWIGSRAFPICNERGEVYRIAGISEDITERKQVEEALAQSAATNSALLNAIPDMIFRCGADGTYLDFKPTKDIKTIVPPSVFLGKNVQEILPPELAQRVLQGHERAISSGETQIVEYQLAKDDEVCDYEARIVARDRHEIIAIVRDITERKRTESALRQQKGLLQTIFDHIPVMICLFDANGQILLLNREFERVMGWSLAEVKNMDLMTQCYPDPEYRAKVWDFMVAATGKWQDFKVRTRDGSYIDSSWANIRLSDGTAIGIGSDITDRKMAEEALRSLTQQEREKAQQLEQALKELTRTQAQLIQNEKMVSLGQLVAGIAHEINNPTSFIYGNIYAADDYARDLLRLIELYTQHYQEPVAEIAEYIKRIDLNFLASDFPKLLASMKEGSRRITEIVQSLRNFSRLDEMECKSVDIHEGLDNTLLILKHRLVRQPTRPEIQVIKEYGALPLVECYPGQLNQVFMNIINNAIDALEKGQGQERSHDSLPIIRIQTEVLEQKWVVIRIADNGGGINSEVLHRIFDPFFTTQPVGQGTGLGLSISYHIVVDRHKGQLTCHSVPGQGAEFVIKLLLTRCCGKLRQCAPIKPTSECSPATPSHPAVRTATNE